MACFNILFLLVKNMYIGNQHPPTNDFQSLPNLNQMSANLFKIYFIKIEFKIMTIAKIFDKI